MGGDGMAQGPRRPGRGPRAVELVVVGLVLVTIAAAATWPLARSPGDSLATGAHADLLLNQYLIAWGAHALASSDAELAHTNMFYPERYTFAYSDMLLSSSILAYPILQATGDTDLAYNLLLLSSMVIGGLGVHVLARSMGLSPVAGAVAGVLYAANPAHLSRISHIQLFTDHWLPWLLWATILWMRACGLRGDGRPASLPRSLALAALVAGSLCAQALTGSHNAVFGAFLVAVVVVVHVAGRSAGGRRPDRPRLRRLIAGSALVVLVSVAILAPVLYPYLQVYDQLQEARLGDPHVEEATLRGGSAGARELLSGASRFWRWLDQVVGWPSAWIAPGRELRAHLFPGLVPLLLAAVGIWPLRPRRLAPPRALFAWGMDLSALVLAGLAVATAISGRYRWAPLGFAMTPPTVLVYPLGAAVALAARRLVDRDAVWVGVAELRALERRWASHPDLLLWAAVSLLCLALALGPDGGVYRLVQAVPGIGLIRVPSRFVLPGLVALTLLAGYGVDRIHRRLGATAFPLLAGALLLFAYEGRVAPLRVGPPPYPPNGLTDWLAEQPGDFAILEIPVDTGPPAAVRQMIRSTHHWKKLLIGYSGSAPPGYRERMEWLDATFPEPRMIERLRDLDVRFVIVDRSLTDEDRIRAAREIPELERVIQFGPREVYRVSRPTDGPGR